MKKILYVRSGPYKLNISEYNSQEIGLAKEFEKLGYAIDIVYYDKKNHNEKISNEISILWRKGLKIFRTGIYFSILKKNFLKNYDIVIASEYSQIMSILLSYRTKNLYIYNGIYYNLFKVKFVERIYDFIFIRILNKNVNHIFNKSILAMNYLKNKGLRKLSVVGVGFDYTKYDNAQIDSDVASLMNLLHRKHVLLYVGQIIKRKNVDFVFQIADRVLSRDKESVLLVIGKGNEQILTNYLSKSNNSDQVIHIKRIANEQLKYIYSISDVLILPSIKEIFGMVILEAMYCKVPVVTSYNGGSSTLIKNNYNGFILNEFCVEKYENIVWEMITNKTHRINIGENAYETIKSDYTWEKISQKILKVINLENK